MLVFMWESITIRRRISSLSIIVELKEGDLDGVDLRVITHLRSKVTLLDYRTVWEDCHLWEKMPWVVESDWFEKRGMLVQGEGS